MESDEDQELKAIIKNSEAAITELAKDIDVKMDDKFMTFESVREVFLACAKICNQQLEELAEKNRPEARKFLKTGDFEAYKTKMIEMFWIIWDIKSLALIVPIFMTKLGCTEKLFSRSMDHYLEGSDQLKAKELIELWKTSLGLKPKKNLTVDELVSAINKRAEVISDISGVSDDSINGVPDGCNFLDMLAYDRCYLEYGFEQEDIEDATKRFKEDPLVVEAIKNFEKALEVRDWRGWRTFDQSDDN